MAPLVLETPEILIYSSADILREDYSHLRISRSVSSIAYVPLLLGEELAGVVEILFFSGTPKLQDLEAIAPIIQLAPAAILAAENGERSARICSNQCTGCRSSTTWRNRSMRLSSWTRSQPRFR